MKFSLFSTCLLGAAVFWNSGIVRAGDWPQFLGPNRNGTSSETGWNQDWFEKEPAVVWRTEVGDGCSSFAVAGGRVFTVGNEGRVQDVVVCLDADTGKLIWKHAFSEKKAPKFYNGGPSATPTVDGGRVYTVSKSGKVLCLEAASGKVVWSRNYEEDFGGVEPSWGYAAAPLVVGNQLIVEPGGPGASVVALDKATGKVIWKSGDSEPGYSAPSFVDGRIVIFQGDGLRGYDPGSGAIQFSLPWKTTHQLNASQAVPYGGGFFVSSGYGSGSGLLIPGSSSPRYVNKKIGLHFQNGVRIGNYLYAGFGQVNVKKCQYQCVRLSDGAVQWSERLGRAISTTIAVDGKLIILTDEGELILANPDPSGFQEIGRIQVLPKTCWSAPAFSNKRIYIRNNDGKAVCLDVSQ